VSESVGEIIDVSANLRESEEKLGSGDILE
jgi:hypothetical protein